MAESNPAQPSSPESSAPGLPTETGNRVARPERREGREQAPIASTPFEDSGRATQGSESEFGGGARLHGLDADIEKEVEEAMGGLSEKELYAEPAAASPAPTDQPAGDDKRKKGRVLAIRAGDVFVDVPGGRSQGVLPASQFPDGPPTVGTEVEFHIEGYDAENGLLLLARQGAAQTADWSSVAVGMIVEARVTSTNKGGLAVDVNGIRGFMPISQIDLYRVEDTEQFVNQRLRCLVIEVKPSERNLVVSRRALLEKEREENREKLWQELAEGQVREGVVRSIRDFGAFVDLGGADGLLHISEMSWTRIKDPSSVVHPGQNVKVIVLKVDRERRKVSLGLKQLTSSPWEDIEAKYSTNSVVQGRVTRLADFGAFVELEPGVEGLIHISELAPQRVRRVAEVVQPEQEVQVMVLNLDPTQRRISLSLKAALSAETEAEDQEPTEEARPERPHNLPLRGGIGNE
jgi:small subunit ribosomal protein S1